jgi:hypothetical protein
MTHSCYKEIAKCRFIINARKKMPGNQESTGLTEDDYKKQLVELLAQCSQNNNSVINALLPDLMQWHVQCTTEPFTQQQSLPATVSGKRAKLAQYIYENSNAVKAWANFRKINERLIKGNYNKTIQTSNQKMKEALTEEIITATNTHSAKPQVVSGGPWLGLFCIPRAVRRDGNTLLPPLPPPLNSIHG